MKTSMNSIIVKKSGPQWCVESSWWLMGCTWCFTHCFWILAPCSSSTSSTSSMFSQLAVCTLMVHLGLWDVFHCTEEKPSLWKTQICVHAQACKAMGALRWSQVTLLGTRTPCQCLFMQYLCVKWWTPWSGHPCVLYTGTSPLRVKICVCVNDRCSKVAIYVNLLCVTS